MALIILFRVIIDIVFCLAIFFFLTFYLPHILGNKIGIDFRHVAGLTMIIAALLFVLVNYLLVKNHIPLGFTDLMRIIGFADSNCEIRKLWERCL